MIAEGRIPMNEAEAEGVQTILDSHAADGENVGLTRNDPGNSGPVRVELADGIWLVDETGEAKKIGKPA